MGRSLSEVSKCWASKTTFKHNASRLHRIGVMTFKVTNWPGSEASLRRRGSLTLVTTPEALSSWQAPTRMTRGSHPCHSDLAIKTALALRLVFVLPLRQKEGFVAFVLKLVGLDPAIRDHTTMSDRTVKPRAPIPPVKETVISR